MSDSDKHNPKVDAAKEKAKEFTDTAMRKIKDISDSPDFKSIETKTWVGVGLAAAFTFFCFIGPLNFRWWIMLPIAGLGIYSLVKQWYRITDKKSVNGRVCLGALIVLGVMILLRDARMSDALLELNKAALNLQDLLK